MKVDKRRDGFLSLSRQAALILAFAVTIWCLMRQVSTLDTIFRAVVVYLSVVIISYIISSTLARILSENEIRQQPEFPLDTEIETDQ